MVEKDRSQGRSGGRAMASIGFEFAAAVAGLTALGVWIDRHYDSSPWGVLIGALIGLVGGTYNTIRVAMLANQKPSDDGARGEDDSEDGS